MNNITELKFSGGSKEELLPDFAADFPYIASRAELDQYAGRFVPWHWHKAAELFYMQSGTLEYNTPKGKLVFPAGSGGFVNSNVLHMTRPISPKADTVQLLHIFDPMLISGNQGSRIERKYVIPITAASSIEVFFLDPDIPAQADLLGLVREAFYYSDEDVGYEIKIREALSKIWIMLYQLISPYLKEGRKLDKNDERLKMMLVYVHEHYGDKITVPKLAEAVFLSERECYRLFRQYLHTTPTEYIRSYRLKEACQMLANTRMSITDIGRFCGLGESSYFGRVFREYAHCTPIEYRKKWQDSTNKCSK